MGGDVLIAVRSVPLLHGHLVSGVGVATRITDRSTTADCLIDPARGCVPFFPILRVFGAEVGWQSSGGNVRLVLGPTLVASDLAPTSVGGQMSVEVLANASSHLGLVAGVRGTVVPKYDSNRFNILAGGVGVRIR